LSFAGWAKTSLLPDITVFDEESIMGKSTDYTSVSNLQSSAELQRRHNILSFQVLVIHEYLFDTHAGT
jgi:hypothetical protein